MIKQISLGIGVIFSLFSVCAMASEYAGVWKDKDGVMYSIHGQSNSLVMAELSSRERIIAPSMMGMLIPSDDEMDLVISGQGYFLLEDSDGVRYITRNGDFKINEAGEIVENSGLRLITRDGSSIPKDWTGLPFTSRDSSDSACGPYWGCPPEPAFTSDIVIDLSGTIFLHDGEGSLYEFDRIQLVWAPAVRQTTDNIPVEINEAGFIQYFYAKDSNSENGFNLTVIMQAMTESRSQIENTWESFGGILNGNSVELKPLSGAVKSKVIRFNSESSAEMTTVCPFDVRFCEADPAAYAPKNITKIY